MNFLVAFLAICALAASAYGQNPTFCMLAVEEGDFRTLPASVRSDICNAAQGTYKTVFNEINKQILNAASKGLTDTVELMSPAIVPTAINYANAQSELNQAKFER